MPDPRAARLLAGKNRLGRIEKDAIFERVLSEVAPRRRPWFWFALPALATAAIAIVLLRPSEEPEFGARGGGKPVASFMPTCGGKVPAATTEIRAIVPVAQCARGDKLLFDLHGTSGYRYFAAFTRDGDGNVIWYVDGKPLALRDGVFKDAVVIGDEHVPGTHLVYAVFSTKPLSRDRIKAMFADLANGSLGKGSRVIVKGIEVQ